MSLAEMLLNGQEKGFYKFPNGSEPLITRKEIEVLLDYDVILIENDVYEDVPALLIENLQGDFDDDDDDYRKVELCKICFHRDKNTKVEPCEHQACDQCLNTYFNSLKFGARKCPWCRGAVKSCTKIRFAYVKKEDVTEKPESEEDITIKIEYK